MLLEMSPESKVTLNTSCAIDDLWNISVPIMFLTVRFEFRDRGSISTVCHITDVELVQVVYT